VEYSHRLQPATADFMISSPLMGREYEHPRRIWTGTRQDKEGKVKYKVQK